MKFNAGDVVILKSGGPAMTVIFEAKNSDDPTIKYHVSWFDGNKECSATFPEATLEQVEL